MSRWKAAGTHLTISLVIATLVGSVIYFVWYPPPYFTVAGGSKLMLLIMGVDVAIGPVLTLAVFKPGKKGLKIDLAVIALLQIAAFCYGLNVIAQARPIFIVINLTQFFTPVYANDLSNADLAAAAPEFSRRSWTGPVLVGTILPTDTHEKNDLVLSAAAGKDIDKFPKYYVPYAQVAVAALAKAKPLSELAARSPQNRSIIDAFLKNGQNSDDLVYLPLHGRTSEFSMILSRSAQRPIGAVEIDPW